MLAQPQNALRRQPSLESNASSALATVASPDPSNAASPISPIFTALCMYDYEPDRASTIPFKRNDLLTIVHKEASGWWAALVDDQIGWVPKDYLKVLTPEMATTMRRLPHAMRAIELDAEYITESSPSTQSRTATPSPCGDDLEYSKLPPTAGNDTYQDQLTPPYNSIDPPTPLNPPEYSEDDYSTYTCGNTNVASPQTESPLYSQLTDDMEEPPTPAPAFTPSQHVLPQTNGTQVLPPGPRQPAKLLQLNKPTPPTPVGKDHTIRIQQPVPPAYRGRSLDNTMAAGHINGHTFASPSIYRSISSISATASLGGASGSSSSMSYRPPSPAVTRLPTAFDQNLRHEISHSRSESPIGDDPVYSPSRNARKVAQITGDDDAQAFHNAKVAQANFPWYLKPRHDNSDIKLEYDGTVIAGTVPALIERLTVDPLKISQEQAYRKAFLTTYKAFTPSGAMQVFGSLREMYEMEHPPRLNEEQFKEWRDKKLRPTQMRILQVLTQWVEKHGLLTDDPALVPRLCEFLSCIKTPHTNALTAKQLRETIDKTQQRLAAVATRSSTPSPTSASVSISSAFPKRRGTKKHKNDFLKSDAGELANQLTILESRAYTKIRPGELLIFPQSPKGDGVRNLTNFCAMNDRLAAWVKLSILSNDGLGKRADTIDHWIRVAERCRAINNISSMSAIVAGLSGADVGRLRLTWQHVARSYHLDPLSKLTEPTSNFNNYRKLHNSLDGPCVPFISMFLTDLVHVNDQYPNLIDASGEPLSSTSSLTPTAVNGGRALVHFAKLQRFSDVINTILKFSSKPYILNENPAMLTFIDSQLTTASSKDQGFFWQRSQDLLSAELAHADIRKGLEAAGF